MTTKREQLQKDTDMVNTVWNEFAAQLTDYINCEFHSIEQKRQMYGRLCGLQFALEAMGVNPDAIKAEIKTQHRIKNNK